MIAIESGFKKNLPKTLASVSLSLLLVACEGRQSADRAAPTPAPTAAAQTANDGVPMTQAVAVAGEDEERARARREAARNAEQAYRMAQETKLQNDFDGARHQFMRIAGLREPGTEQWSALAADELDYGLLLHEANYWLLKSARAPADPATLQEHQTRAERLYRQIIELNGDNPQRVQEIQRRIDQVYVTREALGAAATAQLHARVGELRNYLQEHFFRHGEWPDQRKTAQELAGLLRRAQLPEDKLLIKDFYTSRKGLYMSLLDTQGGPLIVLRGDEREISIKTEGH